MVEKTLIHAGSAGGIRVHLLEEVYIGGLRLELLDDTVPVGGLLLPGGGHVAAAVHEEVGIRP